jgi:hypothetical protein
VAVAELEEALEEAQDRIEELEGDVVDLTAQVDTAFADGFEFGTELIEGQLQEQFQVGFNQGVASVPETDITLDNQDFLEEKLREIADEGAGLGVGADFIQVVYDFFAENGSEDIAFVLQSSIESITTVEEGVSLSFQAIVDALYAGNVTEEQARELITGLTAENQTLLADLNQDGSISTADLLAVLGQFGGDPGSKLNPYFDQEAGLGIDYGTDPLIDP